MSVQTTRYLTREEAEELYVSRGVSLVEERYKKWAKIATNEELEAFIETTYDSYIIKEEE